MDQTEGFAWVKDWERDNAPMIEMIKENAQEKKSQMAEMRSKGTAIQSLVGMLHLWIPRMEKLDHPKCAQTAREMRDELKDLEKILYGKL